MDSKNRRRIWYGIAIIVIAVILVLLLTNKKENTDNSALAQYLTANGAIMYGTEWCPHCKAQKEMFGDSFAYINYIDCDKEQQKCVDAGIEGYPTWIINGQKYPGTQSLDRLAQLIGYQSNQSNVP